MKKDRANLMNLMLQKRLVHVFYNKFNHYKKLKFRGINYFQDLSGISLSLYRKTMLEVKEGYKHFLSSSNNSMTIPQQNAANQGNAL